MSSDINEDGDCSKAGVRRGMLRGMNELSGVEYFGEERLNSGKKGAEEIFKHFFPSCLLSPWYIRLAWEEAL
jgi:hypothetical protein